MSSRFSDLAANERTYLAWIRTAIAVMAFGFLIEKFELFFKMFSKNFSGNYHLSLSTGVEAIGIAMIFVSIMMIIIASIRYLSNRRKICQSMDENDDSFSPVLGTVLAVFLVSISALLMIYVIIRILPGA